MNDGRTTESAHLGALVHTKGGGLTMHVTAVVDIPDANIVQGAWRDETNEVVVGIFKSEDLIVILPPPQIQPPARFGGVGQMRAS